MHGGGKVDRATKLFKALSDETRLRVVSLLLHKDHLCVCEIMQALDISQTRASRNVGILRDAGIVGNKRSGLWVEYYLDKKAMSGAWGSLLAGISDMTKGSGVIAKDRKRLASARRVGPKAAERSR
jgi:ArsR family transcriptional regulator